MNLNQLLEKDVWDDYESFFEDRQDLLAYLKFQVKYMKSEVYSRQDHMETIVRILEDDFMSDNEKAKILENLYNQTRDIFISQS